MIASSACAEGESERHSNNGAVHDQPVLAVAAASLGSSPSNAAEQAAAPIVDAVPIDLRLDPAVESLMSDYGLTTEQAMSQMENQRSLDVAATQLPGKLREVYSGVSIDHSNGGVVAVAATTGEGAAEIADYLTDRGVTSISTEVVPMTDAELEAVAGDLTKALVEKGYPLTEVSVERSSLGRVTVEVSEGADRAEVQRFAESYLADNERLVDARFVTVPPEPVATGDACKWTGDTECDPPLRGSVKMTMPSPGHGSSCSIGFNARSRSDQLPYVTTAGHCWKNDPNWWRSQHSNGTWQWIGHTHNGHNNYWQDSAIVRVLDPQAWGFGQRWITVNPQNGGHTANETYSITAVALPSIGGRVCMTAGNYPGTTCGKVVSTSSSATTGGVTTAYLFKTDAKFCAGGGDSGSPVFSYGVAYGIEVASWTGANCNERIWAEQAVDVENWLNVDIVI